MDVLLCEPRFESYTRCFSVGVYGEDGFTETSIFLGVYLALLLGGHCFFRVEFVLAVSLCSILVVTAAFVT